MSTENANFTIVHNAFPRIGDKLQLLWGQPEFSAYMTGLLQDTRDGTRKGFPADVFFALDALAEFHYQQHPHLRPPSDAWASEAGSLMLQPKSKLFGR